MPSLFDDNRKRFVRIFGTIIKTSLLRVSIAGWQKFYIVIFAEAALPGQFIGSGKRAENSENKIVLADDYLPIIPRAATSFVI